MVVVLVVLVVVVVAVAVAVVVVVVKTLLKHDKPHQLKVGFHKGRVTKCLTNYNKYIINSDKVIYRPTTPIFNCSQSVLIFYSRPQS